MSDKEKEALATAGVVVSLLLPVVGMGLVAWSAKDEIIKGLKEIKNERKPNKDE